MAFVSFLLRYMKQYPSNHTSVLHLIERARFLKKNILIESFKSPDSAENCQK